MKVTFVYPDLYIGWQGEWSGQYNHGLAILSAVLKRAGHQTSLVHVYKQPQKDAFLKRLAEEKPDLIAISTTTHMFPLVRTMCDWIGESETRAPVICGGVHPTLNPEQVIGHPGIDMACVGEGEDAIVEVCESLSQGRPVDGIANIWSRKDGDVVRNKPRPLTRSLEHLPFPDKELFDFENLTLERRGYGAFLMSRGCPYDCSYCCNHALKKVYGTGGVYARRRSVDNVIDEIAQTLKRYPFIKNLIFDDDIFFDRKDWAREFTAKYKAQIGLPFECLERVNVIDEELVRLLKDAGCVKVKIGLESGNEFIRNHVLKRNMSQQMIRKAIALIRGQGIEVLTANILGIPFETAERIMETIKLNAEMNVDFIQHSVFYPYPQTKLHDLCVEHGFLTGRESYTFFGDSVLKLDSVTPDQVNLFQRYYDHIFRLYRRLNRSHAGKHVIPYLDTFYCSGMWPVTGKYLLNPVHTFYRRHIKNHLR